MKNKYINIWLATVLVCSVTFYVIGNHVATKLNNELANSVIYRLPDELGGLPKIESIGVVTYIANGRQSSCVMIKCTQPLNIESAILQRDEMNKALDAVLGYGSSSIQEIASSFSSGGSLVASRNNMIVFINKKHDTIVIPKYNL